MQDQRLAHWIQSSLSETIMILVVGLSTSHEIWQALEKSFAHQSKAKVMQYKMRLQTLKKESLSMRAFLNQVKSCCDLLAAAGCKISEEDQILHILSGLGTDYNPVMVTITSKTEGWTVQDVSAILMSYESRLEEIKSSSISADASLPSTHLVQSNQRSNFSTNNNYRNDGGRGFNFRGRGGRYGGRGGRSGGKIICQLCQKPGHGADKCWYRYEQNFVPNTPHIRNQNPASHGSYQMNPAANVAQIRRQSYFQNTSQAPVQQTPSEYNIDASSSTSWYPDSGATNHISHDFGNLNSASEYRGDIQGNHPQGNS